MRTEDGKWKMENGERKTENGKQGNVMIKN